MNFFLDILFFVFFFFFAFLSLLLSVKLFLHPFLFNLYRYLQDVLLGTFSTVWDLFSLVVRLIPYSLTQCLAGSPRTSQLTTHPITADRVLNCSYATYLSQLTLGRVLLLANLSHIGRCDIAGCCLKKMWCWHSPRLHAKSFLLWTL